MAQLSEQSHWSERLNSLPMSYTAVKFSLSFENQQRSNRFKVCFVCFASRFTIALLTLDCCQARRMMLLTRGDKLPPRVSGVASVRRRGSRCRASLPCLSGQQGDGRWSTRRRKYKFHSEGSLMFCICKSLLLEEVEDMCSG